MRCRDYDGSARRVLTVCNLLMSANWAVWRVLHKFALAVQDNVHPNSLFVLRAECGGRIIVEVRNALSMAELPYPDDLEAAISSAVNDVMDEMVAAPSFQPCDLLAHMAVDELRDKLLSPLQTHWMGEDREFGGSNAAGRIVRLITAFDDFLPKATALVEWFMGALEHGNPGVERCLGLSPLVRKFSRLAEIEESRTWTITDRISARVRTLTTEWVDRGGDSHLAKKAALLKLKHLFALELETILVGELELLD